MTETPRDNEETIANNPAGKTENFVSKHFVRLLVWLAVSGGALAIFGPWLLYVTGLTGETDANLRLHILYVTGGTIAVLGLVETHRKNTTDRLKAEADIQNYQASQSYQSKTLNEQARQFTETIAKEREKIEVDKAKNEQDHIRQVHTERRNRYTTAIEQLSNDKASIRLGGVYTLVGLVDEWLADEIAIPNIEERRKEGQVIINNLCAYIRSPFLLAERAVQLDEPYAKDLQKDFDGNKEKLEADKQTFKQHKAALEEERQIRLSIIKEIREHLYNDREPGSWSGFDYNFSNAHFFYLTDFSDSLFDTSSNFTQATFTEDSDFSGAIFTEASFSGAEFTKNAGFFRAEFAKHTDFTEVTFIGNATFSEVKFAQSANFSKAKLTEDADFSGAEFTEASFSETIFTKASFSRAEFTQNADFSGAEFTEASFSWVKFTQNADFSEAKFTQNADFSEAKFTQNADFSWAEFTKASFSRAEFTKASFSRAEFTQNADFSGAKFTKASFSRAEFTKASFSWVKFTGYADFYEAKFTQNADFSRAKFTEASFSRAKFTEASFSRAEFTGYADFFRAKFTQNADFSWAEFTKASFSWAEFTKASFSRAEFTKASFSWVKFTGYANLSGAKFTQNANFSEAKFTEASFSRAEFTQDANFSGAEFTQNVSFSGATFRSKPIFTLGNKARFSHRANPEDYNFKVSHNSPYKIETKEQEHNGIKFVIPKDAELFDPDEPSEQGNNDGN